MEQVRLRTVLVGLVLAGLAPMGLLAAVLLGANWHAQDERAREQLQTSARTMSLVVERQLSSAIRRLKILAASPQVDTDLRAFYGHCAEALRLSPDWRNVLLLGGDGQQLLNLAQPYGATLPRAGDREYQRLALESGQATVSDLFRGRVTGAWSVDVAVPVPGPRPQPLLLVASLRLDQLRELLSEHRLRGDLGVTLLDSRHRTIASTRDDQPTGVPPPNAELRTALDGNAEGTRRLQYPKGPTFVAWAPIAGPDWDLVAQLPAAVVDGPIRRSAAIWAFAWAAVLLVAGGLAIRRARALCVWIDEAADAALRVAAGGEARLEPPRILELARLRDALHESAHNLQEAAAARGVAEAARDEVLAREQASREAAEAESRAKDVFLAMLGHELRTPISAIANAGHVLRSAADGERVAWAAGIIERQSSHLTRLLGDLLDVGRLLIGKVRLDIHPLDLRDVVRSSLAALQSSGATQHHALAVQLDSAHVDGDRVRLEQVVANVVGNALKYTPPPGEVRVVLRVEGREAVLEVQDNGIGIEPGLLARVFDLFVQDDRRNAGRGGLGMGLALVHRLVELHGGSIAIASEGAGRGTKVTVRLPLSKA